MFFLYLNSTYRLHRKIPILIEVRDFIKAGGYEVGKSEEQTHFFRFLEPKASSYPKAIGLFSGFVTEYNLPFVLLSNTELSAIQAYGVWQEKKLYGKVSMGVVRTTFLIDEQGNIQAVMPKVKPDTNADEILALLEN